MKHTKETHTKYLDWLKGSQYSTNVIRNYSYYSIGLIGREINQEEVSRLCLGKQGHHVYRSFLKTITLCFKLERDIIIPKIRGRRKEVLIIHFTKEEINKILDNIKEYRLHLIIRLMYENGLRISEVLSLSKKNFDMINHRVKGIGKGNKPFNIKIQDRTYELLVKYLSKFEDKDECIFTWDKVKHQRQKALYDLKKTIKDILPYKESNEIFCHAFRHTTGTHLREQGFDLREIQTYLRHKQLETVANYTFVDKQKLEKKIDGVFK